MAADQAVAGREGSGRLNRDKGLAQDAWYWEATATFHTNLSANGIVTARRKNSERTGASARRNRLGFQAVGYEVTKGWFEE